MGLRPSLVTDCWKASRSWDAPSRHKRAEPVAPHPLGFVIWHPATQFERGESLTERVELPGSGRHRAVSQLTGMAKATDPFVEAGKGMIGGTKEPAKEFARNVDPLHPDAEEGWVLDGEAPEDEARLHQVHGGIVGARQRIDCRAKQIEGARAKRDDQTVLRREQAVHGSRRGSGFACHAAYR